MSVLLFRKTEDSERPYTLAMAIAEEAIKTTAMVMIQSGWEKEIWNTCSHMCAARGLNEEQSRRVVAAATERAKRQMRY